ncbi:MAG: hypothetical protein OXG33_01480 [Chloroflexi bacterium]|nr:hypothetical protein [Chloroflexota bacterium]
MQAPNEIVWQAITAGATSLVAIGVLIRGFLWCAGKWKRRVSWRSLNPFEKDVIWGVVATGVSSITVDYDCVHTSSEKALAFVCDDGKLADNRSIQGTRMHLHPLYVIHLESLQDKDLVRPYSKVLLDLAPNTYAARPRLERFIVSDGKRIRKYEANALKKINFADAPTVAGQ